MIQLLQPFAGDMGVHLWTLGRTVDRDGFLIRRAAVEARVPCLTSLDTALAVVTALRASALTYDVAALDEYRAGATAGAPAAAD